MVQNETKKDLNQTNGTKFSRVFQYCCENKVLVTISIITIVLLLGLIGWIIVRNYQRRRGRSCHHQIRDIFSEKSKISKEFSNGMALVIRESLDNSVLEIREKIEKEVENKIKEALDKNDYQTQRVNQNEIEIPSLEESVSDPSFHQYFKTCFSSYMKNGKRNQFGNVSIEPCEISFSENERKGFSQEFSDKTSYCKKYTIYQYVGEDLQTNGDLPSVPLSTFFAVRSDFPVSQENVSSVFSFYAIPPSIFSQKIELQNEFVKGRLSLVVSNFSKESCYYREKTAEQIGFSLENANYFSELFSKDQNKNSFSDEVFSTMFFVPS